MRCTKSGRKGLGMTTFLTTLIAIYLDQNDDDNYS
jgi:hypothetical protein